MSRKTPGGWPESQGNSMPSFKDPETWMGKLVLYLVLFFLFSLVSFLPLVLLIFGVTF